jgi:hypothetical protein
MPLLPQECQILLEILDHCSPSHRPSYDWPGARKLYRRLYGSRDDWTTLTHDEHIMVVQGLEAELCYNDYGYGNGEFLLYTKMAYCLRLIKEQMAGCPECKAENKKRTSCHNCGINNQTYWYTLQHIDGTIVKRLCIKCVQDDSAQALQMI